MMDNGSFNVDVEMDMQEKAKRKESVETLEELSTRNVIVVELSS